MNLNPPIDCGLPIFTSDSWLNGDYCLLPVNDNLGTPFYVYSYDILNKFVEKLGSKDHFPNMENITLFGFSAGAQVQ